MDIDKREYPKRDAPQIEEQEDSLPFMPSQPGSTEKRGQPDQ